MMLLEQQEESAAIQELLMALNLVEVAEVCP